MKNRILLVSVVLAVLLSGCVVYSFYPLFTEKDLFPNDLLKGTWIEAESENTPFESAEGIWKFEHPYIDKEKGDALDSLSYVLDLKTMEGDSIVESHFDVHIIKLGNQYFLDFYLNDFMGDSNLKLADFHVVPVHTFAKLTLGTNQITINWFDPDWLAKLIKENKIRIHHEQSDDLVLLTAKPQELQKFVTKYVHSEEAFEDGLEVVLYRK